MAFRLKLNETMDAGIRRIGLAQIDRAAAYIDAMGPRPAAASDVVTPVHETRKCLKRLRALLKFARPLLDEAEGRAMGHAARDLGRRLSGTRDLDVLDHTVSRLQGSSALKPATFERLHRALSAARLQPKTDAPPGHADAPLTEDLRSIRERWSALELKSAGRDLLVDGLAHSLDQCRTQFDRAFETGDGETFHDWRKAVQLHWRHMQLVQRAWPEYCGARLAEAKAISALVGDDRDLAMLQAFATAQSLPQLVQRDIAKAVAQLSPAYRTEAHARGGRLLADGTRGLTRRLEQYWKSARQLRKLARDNAKSAPDKA